MNNLIAGYIISTKEYQNAVKLILKYHLEGIEKRILIDWDEDGDIFPEIKQIKIVTEKNTYVYRNETLIRRKYTNNTKEYEFVLRCIKLMINEINFSFIVIQKKKIIENRDKIRNELIRIITYKQNKSTFINMLFGIEFIFPFNDNYLLDELPPGEIRLDGAIVAKKEIERSFRFNDLAYFTLGILDASEKLAKEWY